MAKTAEGAVKADVRKELHRAGVLPFSEVASGKHPTAVGTYYMPVAGPFSVHGVHDFVGCWLGVFFSLETKAPDNPSDETFHQGQFREAVMRSGGIALTGVRDGAAAVARVKQLVSERVSAAPQLEGLV